MRLWHFPGQNIIDFSLHLLWNLNLVSYHDLWVYSTYPTPLPISLNLSSTFLPLLSMLHYLLSYFFFKYAKPTSRYLHLEFPITAVQCSSLISSHGSHLHIIQICVQILSHFWGLLWLPFFYYSLSFLSENILFMSACPP